MSKTKKQLMSSAPWRVEEAEDEFQDAKLKVTSQPGSTPTMHVPKKKTKRSKDQDYEDSLTEIDPELRYSFQRNFQVFLSLPQGNFLNICCYALKLFVNLVVFINLWFELETHNVFV